MRKIECISTNCFGPQSDYVEVFHKNKALEEDTFTPSQILSALTQQRTTQSSSLKTCVPCELGLYLIKFLTLLLHLDVGLALRVTYTSSS